jgi:hypothetical protein
MSSLTSISPNRSQSFARSRQLPRPFQVDYEPDED